MRRRSASAVVAAATGTLLALALFPSSAVSSSAQGPAPRDPAAQAADRLVAAKPALIRKSANDKVHRLGVTPGVGGLQYVSYARTYAGLPVYGGDFVVVSNATGGVLSTSVAQSEVLDVATTPSVSSAQAAATARAELSQVTAVSAPQLTVMARGKGRLAYEVVATGVREGRESKLHVYVDALTGAVAEQWDEVMAGTGQSFYHGTVTIGTTQSGGTFSMADPGRPGIRCGGQNGATFTGPDDNWGNGTGTNLETACVDGLHAVGKEWDMLGAWLGRNGINGTGGGFPMRVGLNQANAFWNGSYTNFGRSSDGQRQATAMDVVAHEYGHAIFQTTPGGAGGSNEKGGLNESNGDIFGALTEFFANEPAQFDPPDYDVGEEVNLTGNGPIRFMHNPSLRNHPNCFSSSVPGMEVHAAAGVQNHWFYLLGAGSNPGGGLPASPTCNGSTVTGIGILKAGQIYMGTLLRKTSTWTHQLARRASLQAALQLFPGSCVEFTTTRAAWNAVSVPADPQEPTTCTPGGNDFSMTLNPTSATVQPGQQATTTVSTQTTAGSPQTVTFSASGLPPGATATFNPPSVQSGASSTLTISVAAGTPAQTYNVIVTGDGTSVDRTATFTLNVGGAGNVVFEDNFETTMGWTTNAGGTDTATTGQWVRGDPAATTFSGTNLQLGTTTSGTNDLVTGAAAGASVGEFDVDGGTTTIRSPQITLPTGTLSLTFSWYLGHLNNSSSADFFRVRVLSGATNTVVFEQLGAAANRSAAWQSATVNLSSFAGQAVRIQVEAADASTASLVESGVDDVRVLRS